MKKQGRLILDHEARQFEVVAKHNEWLDVMQSRMDAYPKLVEMMKAAAPFVDYVANNGNLNAHGLHVEMLALLREIGEAA